MTQFREMNQVRVGVVGTVVLVLSVLCALNIRSLSLFDDGTSYTARFVDAGGLNDGDTVQVSGKDAGRVTGIDIDHDAVAVTFTVDDRVTLGTDTTVEIATATALGARHLRVRPAGSGRLEPGSTLGLDRTTAPYQLTDALGDLTTTTSDLDAEQLRASMRALSGTLRDTPDDVAAALDGVLRLSATVATRDESLRELLGHAEQVTAVLAERSDAIDGLIVDADRLLIELDHRRRSLDTLFANVQALSVGLGNLIADNEAQLAPTLGKVNAILDILTRNRDNIALAIERLGPYATELGEAVASGPFFNSYIQNLLPAQVIEPALTAALERAGFTGPGGTP
ncbi:MCE family protein [Rhodococcus chondri]|uniref:MCE family protein n=1 Tax=Rhodococcus chondri TaxID=3065941 RepID=A0ABU7JZ24_9NOCA|nr:MCE family protein [Rhodococcus sp. CC-R104]MEE2035184.1 MCE family protein [Rhodococcus sp. CC-R104]